MPAQYAPLPNPRSVPDMERELNDAFGFDREEDADESVPLTRHQGQALSSDNRNLIPGAYDFEREYGYDYPPPGSPPRPTAFALPNDIGNSNGRLPSSPIHVPAQRPSFFRKAVGAILPTHYSRINTESTRTINRGGGIENDGVFANVVAKPQRANMTQTEDGEVYMVPEDTQTDIPPSYAVAQLDSVPPYWETTVHAPSGLTFGSDMIIDDLPSGSIWIFALNLVTSCFFQFIGFLITYLLHTSHAAKYGSRAGLGLTLIRYGFYSRTGPIIEVHGVDTDLGDGSFGFPDGTPHITNSLSPTLTQPTQVESSGITLREWLSFLLMTIGWFLLLASAAGFWRVKRWESSIRSTDAGPITVEDIERDIALRRNMENVLGISTHAGEEGTWVIQNTEYGNDVDDRVVLEDARVARHLAAAGLI